MKSTCCAIMLVHIDLSNLLIIHELETAHDMAVWYCFYKLVPRVLSPLYRSGVCTLHHLHAELNPYWHVKEMVELIKAYTQKNVCSVTAFNSTDIRAEQDNVATPVTAMMATVCISTDIRLDLLKVRISLPTRTTKRETWSKSNIRHATELMW